MLDYSIFYRRAIEPGRVKRELPHFDVFISAYNTSERINRVFDDVRATQKFWLVQPEYGFMPLDVPATGTSIIPGSRDEADQIGHLLQVVGPLTGCSVCIDITGFMRHTLAFLLARLARAGVSSFTAAYSEPTHYSKQENTEFSTETSGVVRPIKGMFGSYQANSPEHLIIGVGYDHKLIGEVANYKDSSTVHPIFAFPSLSPDMYQQSALRASHSGEVSLENAWVSNRRFAPAHDPFATAEVLSQLVSDIDRKHRGANVYLAPLSTKAQALGFALYWELEGRKRDAVTMLMPECITYARETGIGLRRCWAYSVEIL